MASETHYLAGQGINSISVADVNGDGKPDLVIANGGAALTNPVANLETLATNPDVNTGGITVLLNHAQTATLLPTTVSLLLCVDPPGSNFPCANPIANTPLISPITMYYGQSLDGVAIESATNLTGTLTFYSGSTVFCTLNANLSQGSQTCPPGSGIFPAGTTTVTAVYSGDSVYAGSTSNAIVVTVYPDIITTATVTSSLNPATFGQSVTFTADVQGNFAVGTGQVIFLDVTTTLVTATLDPTGHATLTTSTLIPGTHLIRVVLTGSQNFNSATSGTLNQVILPPTTPIASNVALASSLTPSVFGQTVTFTPRTVTAPAAFPVIPTGSVTFFDGTLNLGNSVVNPATGIATFTTSTLAIGSHPITASYSGAPGNGTTTPTILASTSTRIDPGSRVASTAQLHPHRNAIASHHRRRRHGNSAREGESSGRILATRRAHLHRPPEGIHLHLRPADDAVRRRFDDAPGSRLRTAQLRQHDAVLRQQHGHRNAVKNRTLHALRRRHPARGLPSPP